MSKKLLPSILASLVVGASLSGVAQAEEATEEAVQVYCEDGTICIGEAEAEPECEE